MEALIVITPFLGDTNLDPERHRFLSVNLEGWQRAEKEMLTALVTLHIHELFATPRSGKSLFLFDEAHEYPELYPMFDRLHRETRKYRASLVLSSQDPGELAQFLNNVAHLLLFNLNVLPKNPAQWRFPAAILDLALSAPNPKSVGYPTVHLASEGAQGPVAGVFRYYGSPVEQYTFASEKQTRAY